MSRETVHAPTPGPASVARNSTAGGVRWRPRCLSTLAMAAGPPSMGVAAGRPVGVRRGRRLRPDAGQGHPRPRLVLVQPRRRRSVRTDGGLVLRRELGSLRRVKVLGLASSLAGHGQRAVFLPRASRWPLWRRTGSPASRHLADAAAVVVGVLFSVLPGHQHDVPALVARRPSGSCPSRIWLVLSSGQVAGRPSAGLSVHGVRVRLTGAGRSGRRAWAASTTWSSRSSC